MEWHPIASVFPMLSDEELQALADDIRAHGLKEPVTTFEGKILDGRNRAAACLIAGVELSTVAFEGSRDEALAFSWSKNRRRRQLDSSQSAIAEARRARLSQEYAAEVERMKAEAADRKASQGGDKKSAAAKALPKIAGEILTTSDRDSGKTRDIRAKAAGTNGSYIQIADKIEAERPDVGERILKGCGRNFTSYSGLRQDSRHPCKSCRHTPAIAEARRARLSQEYAAEVERMKAEAADRKASQGGDKKSAAAKALPKIAGEILTTSDRDSGKTRDIRAKAAGTNGSYIQIADKIEAERPDVGERILKGELTIPAAQKLIREESEPPRVDASQSKLIGVGVIRANEAVNCLKAIPANDKLRKRGFQIVADWIKRNL